MIVFLEGRVIIGRQHFAVGVDIDACTVGLLQELFQVFQIVAGNKNARVPAHADVHLRDFGFAVGFGIGLVEQGHGLSLPSGRTP